MQVWSQILCDFLEDVFSAELEKMSLNTDIVYNEAMWWHIKF